MYGSLFLLATLPLIGTTASPQTEKEKKDKSQPNTIRKIEPEMADLSGYYTCKGQETGGKNYSGIVVMIKKNDVYLIQWVVGGGSTFSGIASRQGNILAASWSIPGERGIVRGVNLYRVESATSGPRLVGRWASVPGPGIQQTEELRFLKKFEDGED